MSRLLFYLLLAFLAWQLLRGKRPGRRRRSRGTEAVVPCSRCGLHVPLGESLERAGRRYCCQEHLKLDADGR